jgi:hypothetical protein
MRFKNNKIRFVIAAIFIIILSSCGKLSTIPMTPEITPEDWLAVNPHIQIGNLIIATPSSSFIVYLLAIITLLVGIKFLRIAGNEKSKYWWGLGLILWGIGTIFAGTSYQAFTYQIKCAGKAICSWTSWYEVIYMNFEVASVNAILLAVGYSIMANKKLSLLKIYCLTNYVIYLAVSLSGAFIPSWFLVSFELMSLFCIPGLITAFTLSIGAYNKEHDLMNRNLIITWAALFLIMAAYYAYFLAGFTEKLWSQGIWFSANDVLHIGLIAWMLYIYFAVADKVKDKK